MNLTEEQLKNLEEFSKHPQFSIPDLAKILEVDPQQLLSELLLQNTGSTKAYRKGSLLALAEFGKKVTQLSNQGSGPAQTLFAKLRKESEVNTFLNYYG